MAIVGWLQSTLDKAGKLTTNFPPAGAFGDKAYSLVVSILFSDTESVLPRDVGAVCPSDKAFEDTKGMTFSVA